MENFLSAEALSDANATEDTMYQDSTAELSAIAADGGLQGNQVLQEVQWRA